jgi:hypothetical protein
MMVRIPIPETACGKAWVRNGRPHREALLLFTIAAVLFVGIQSRVSQSIPTRNPQELLRSFSDPVKVPPPEERNLDFGSPAIAVQSGVIEPSTLPLTDGNGNAPYVGEERSPANPLRAPPTSL